MIPRQLAKTMKTLLNQSLIEKQSLFPSENSQVNRKTDVMQVTKNTTLIGLFYAIAHILGLVWIKLRTAILILFIMSMATAVLTKLIIHAVDKEYAAQQEMMLDYQDELKHSLPFDAPTEDQ
ncbi:hypothetical protein F965_00034 [Acinetobacter schindleri NIPH 900]|uniref:Uncharacterized protein n=2 Tax=Acinetobacter schindleri TaxID=108981 RepID=N8Y500_9GAMM|nr:hypothetical protein F965_00034 [Acinetobacter schindleri NIPH 900]